MARTEKGTLHTYAHQTTIIIGQKVFPLMVKGQTGDSTRAAVRLIEDSIAASLQHSGWSVMKGKGKALRMRSRTLRAQAKGKGKGKPRGGKGAGNNEEGAGWTRVGGRGIGKGKGGPSREGAPPLGKGSGRPRALPADAVAIVIGTSRSLYGEAVVPAQLSVTRPMTDGPIILAGARTERPDFRVAGQKDFDDLGSRYKKGFYPNQIGRSIKEEEYQPKNDKERMQTEAITEAIEATMPGAEVCKIFVQKRVRKKEGAHVCDPRRGCRRQPCL